MTFDTPEPLPARTPKILPSNNLTLDLKPFLEVLSPEHTQLGRLTNYQFSTTAANHPQNPRFDIAGYPVLTMEVTGAAPMRDIVFLYHWWDKSGTALGMRDSHHMFRTPYDAVAATAWDELQKDNFARIPLDPSERYSDIFTGIPAQEGATRTAFYVQDVFMKSGALGNSGQIRLSGQSLLRSDLNPNFISVISAPAGPAAGDIWHTLDFGRVSNKSITGTGVHFRIAGASELYYVKADHDLGTVNSAAELVIGSMLPQTVAYKTTTGEFRTLYFSNADLTKIRFDQANAAIDFDVYSYDYRERTLRATGSYPPNGKVRIHRNLGITDWLPASRISIVHSRSSILAFPLWQPNANLAALAITEHADYVGVEQDMLTMYGGPQAQVKNGEGLLGNKIPITKSIYSGGPGQTFVSRTQSNAAQGSVTATSLKASSDFLEQLRGYKALGGNVEIAAHCIWGSSDNDQGTLEGYNEAFGRLAEFRPVTWVDHGGQECLWQSGWDPTSNYYIIRLLKEHGYKYFNALGDKYDGRLNMIADNAPSHVLFYSPGIDDNLDDDWKPLFFTTTPMNFSKDNFTPKHIREIINARGLINIHTYLPYEALYFERGEDGNLHYQINNWYNESLQNISAANREGNIFLATTSTLNDYIWKVRGISYYAAGGKVYVRNPGKEAINGLTFGFRDAATGRSPTPEIADVKILGTRTYDGMNYVWFDLPGATADSKAN